MLVKSLLLGERLSNAADSHKVYLPKSYCSIINPTLVRDRREPAQTGRKGIAGRCTKTFEYAAHQVPDTHIVREREWGGHEPMVDAWRIGHGTMVDGSSFVRKKERILLHGNRLLVITSGG